MTWIDIDGHTVSETERGFALTVSDSIPMEALSDRIAYIGNLSHRFSHLRFICVRNDSGDRELFAAAVASASGTGLGLVLESRDPLCLYDSVTSMPDRKPLLCVNDQGRLREVAMLSSLTGCPMTVPGDGTENLMENVETAEICGATGLVLCPGYTSMKGCLETNTDLHRLSSEHSFPQAMHPVMTRTWSGEYALSVASVSVMSHGALIVLDDLDPDGCGILDSLLGLY